MHRDARQRFELRYIHGIRIGLACGDIGNLPNQVLFSITDRHRRPRRRECQRHFLCRFQCFILCI